MVNERPGVSTSGALFMARSVLYIHINQKIKTMFTVQITPFIIAYLDLPEDIMLVHLN
jgi:hypothetical protein